MNIFSNPTVTRIANNKSVQKFVSQMSNHKAMLPVIMLEASVISGRCYQAYKRGGMTECRERMIDESLTAIVWFGIIKWLNKGFGKLIKQKGIFDKNGLPEIETDLGKDAIRNPIQRAINARPEIKNKIGSLKFTKIMLAALAGIYLSGLVLPKFYQNLTKKILNKEKKKTQEKANTNPPELKNKITMQDFIQKIKKSSQPTFGRMNASELINTTAHILENNPIANLLTVDVGLFAGRGYSARNNDERVELLFRDFSSSFFYMFSTPLVYNGLSKFVDKFKGKNTAIDPKTAHFISQNLASEVGKYKNIDDLRKALLGGNDNILMKAFTKFEGETVSINTFKEQIKNLVGENKQLSDEIIKRGEQFIKLRPEGASQELLTMSEVINSIKGGYVNKPEFLTKAVEISTDGVSQNPQRFISFKEIDKIKSNITKYVESIFDYAKANGLDKITPEFLTQARNRNFIMKTGYTLAGMTVSALFLSTIIPKLQYKITEWRTGRKDFPGVKDIK